MKPMRNSIFILTFGLAFVVTTSASNTTDHTAEASWQQHIAAVQDTIPEDESMVGTDTIGRSRKNLATGLDAMQYKMEHRHLYYGDSIRRRWYDNFFVEGGIGLEQMVPAVHDYNFNTLTTAHIGVGKTLTRLHSVRLTLGGAFGYQKDKDIFFYKYNAKLDHLFSLSSYINGYNPARLLDVSTVLGVGAQYAHLGLTGSSGKAFEAHLGLQFRFFTGPQGYINVEPYYGIATDAMDLSEYRNWRRVDMFYGANINFIYYLNNNLSRRSRDMFIRSRSERNYLTADSMLQSWRQPWFFEVSNGFTFVSSVGLPFAETMGHEIAVAAGKWISPVIGLRLSAATAIGTWQKTTIAEEPSPYHPEYHRYYNSLYFGARAEALLNPFGFNRNYDWDSRFGFYVVGGVGIGRMSKYQNDRKLACRTESYSAGLHLWTSLTPGLQLFVEPCYTYYSYKIPYSNVDWNKRYSDDNYTLNMGLTVLTRGRRFRQKVDATEKAVAAESRMTVGLGGGMNLMQTKGGYDAGASSIAYNGLAYGEYRVNDIFSARLAFEFASFAATGMTNFIDYNMANVADNYTPVSRKGLWNHRYFLGFLSASYMANLITLCDGYRPNRLFEFSVFAGPTCAIIFGENASLSKDERLLAGHEVRKKEPLETGVSLGFHGGVKLAASVTPRLAVVFTPTIYLLTNDRLPCVESLKLRYLETLNLGVQYKL